MYLILGAQPPTIVWAPPCALTPSSRQYVSEIVRLPPLGVKRLAYFQDHLEDPEELLARDSYDEFALAPYSILQTMKGQLQHDKLLDRVQDASITPIHRRLYLTMLGVCGAPSDLPVLEKLLRSDDPKFKSGLDATVACYLTLKGAAGLPLVEDLFLKKKSEDFVDINSVVMAMRFLGQEDRGTIPRDRIVATMRLVLDHPQLADQAIMDLARWQDWSVMDRIVALFKSNDPDVNTWVRIPAINYLRACPLPIAKQHIEELRKIDPHAVRESETQYAVLGLNGGSAPIPDGAVPNASDQNGVPDKASLDAAATAPAYAAKVPPGDAPTSTFGLLHTPAPWIGLGAIAGIMLLVAALRGARGKSIAESSKRE